VKIVLFDIDGVVADASDRFTTLYDGCHQPDWKPDWYRFHDERMDIDPVIPGGAAMLRAAYYHMPSVAVGLITNRLDKFRHRTRVWLANNALPYDHLFMRGEHDYTNFKGHILDNLLSQGCTILYGVDDDPLHREVYEKRGIPFVYFHSGYNELSHLIREREA